VPLVSTNLAACWKIGEYDGQQEDWYIEVIKKLTGCRRKLADGDLRYEHHRS